ncbi:hypothetical protein BH09ACT5_BH09ACT5_09550 [soil metagenome]
MAGKHRYEPEVRRATWVPAEENADPSRVEHLNTGLNEVPVPVRAPWWARFRRDKAV